MSVEGRDLLIELGTEELPPKALRGLSEALAAEILKGLADAELAHAGHHIYAAPRRLALRVENLALRQADKQIERRGPALAAAYDAQGQPTKAAQGFARSVGTEVSALQTLKTDKGAWLVYRGEQAGRPAAELIPALLERALNRLPIPKRMRWGAGDAAFVRPVHWLVLMHGDEVIDAELLGVRSGRASRGHRFHHPEAITLRSPADYPAQLREAHVLVDFAQRQARIAELVAQGAASIEGRAVVDPELLEEVTALVEWPELILGRFDEEFLDVPAEALISSMQEHQKYFPVRDGDGRLLPRFIAIANIASRDPAQVRAGNERVIRPRLADAAFFWNRDRRHRLAEQRSRLAEVVFQKQLGSLAEKSARVAAVAAELASRLGADPSQARRAAELGKCDLMTEMVGEFPELQGIMGRYYALHDGEPDAVAQALDEQYQPRFAGDEVPASTLGQVLAVAERADTLMGIFAIGRAPSGDKDPFGLRRAALGLMRTLIERELDVDLRELLAGAAAQQPAAVKAAEQLDAVYAFCLERLRGYYQEQGVGVEVFDAVAVLEPARPLDFHRRLIACRDFQRLPEAESLAAANKRIRNILRKSEEAIPEQVDTARLEQAQEQALHQAVQAADADVAPLLAAGDYAGALKRLAALRAPVDAFFDGVLVNAEDAAVRANRYALLASIQALFLAIADISRLPSS
ncbi:glycine--tRNA ligase subunit beta [Alkalilimnicola sp. S0819]|uniref:glycine--tRNA ligase subunit beta n=1 Tax=Alkalilimnicola sp. S0819 TaxID=2613922 RepID=UPI001262332A|nr:glycine--tRNA ligase subunit beta [Alkalilimnicola sp. S0819]KAB7622733.1 glycine--tRNA ligase subunit beta [Alkalilimnicola sp. S0819]MPQ17373.1 glycine--tRNA ligase subunit beta [Alkalilimnicola sp. S0819]